MTPRAPKDLSRRGFLGCASGAAIVAATSARPRWSPPFAAYERRNVHGMSMKKGPLKSYADGIAAMLKLPPSDPRNWYRHALVHLMDCPHGNWWFLPWHRGYLGWLERTLRALSNDPAFALPYWDWTAHMEVPEQFFEGVLNLDDDAYIASFERFYREFKDPVSDLWKSLTPAQLTQLKRRSGTFSTQEGLWETIGGKAAGGSGQSIFFSRGKTRLLSKKH
ncbi:MAG: tyrosinase family protein, partial [Planctomycetota bacterium]